MGGELYWLTSKYDQNKWLKIIQPDSPLAQLLELKVVEVGPGRSLIKLVVHPTILNSKRMLHNGLYAALAHYCMDTAVRSTGKQVAYVNLQIGYVRPIDVGQVMECKGLVIHNGQQIMVTEARMCVPGGTVATAGGIYYLDSSYCRKKETLRE